MNAHPFECAYRGRLLAGVDEVGRGPLVGPVVTAAVILDPDRPIPALNDSKRLSARRREALSEEIRQKALAWALGECTASEVDQLNIYQATLLAMKRAVAALNPAPEYVLVDGNRLPDWHWAGEAVVQGDGRVPAISAASILAKVHRDEQMLVLHDRYPQYGFDRHKGYPTREHRQAILQHGVIPEHRRSFRPVREALEVGRQGSLFTS